MKSLASSKNTHGRILNIAKSLLAAALIESLECRSLRNAALSAALIRCSKFQSSGACTGNRLDQVFEICNVRSGCASSRLEMGARNYDNVEGALAGT